MEMPSTALNGMTIGQYRCFYAEEIRTVASIDSPALVDAFASVPREQFLGPPPWSFHSGPSLLQPVYRTTMDVRDLYHDVFVALKASQLLNNGQPSLIARLIGALNLATGKRVLHIGSGTGYYTAIMAEVVGSEGLVTAVEVDPVLAVQAAANLIRYGQVAVINRDGAAVDPSPYDAILVNAGVTHPHPSWLESLTEAGVLVLPLGVGKSPSAKDHMVLKITRHRDRYSADLLLLMTIYASTSQRDPAIHDLLNESLESRRIIGLKSVRTLEHPQTDTCIVHTPGFCLSADAIGPAESQPLGIGTQTHPP
jgi:protein-L-isoaspartate(D-aspartate) O-methyltransferase